MSAQPLTLSRVLGDWTVDPVLLCVLCLTGLLYGWGAIRCRRRWAIWRTTSFMAGLFVVALALLSGSTSTRMSCCRFTSLSTCC